METLGACGNTRHRDTDLTIASPSRKARPAPCNIEPGWVGDCSGGLKAEADTETGQEPPGRRPFRDPWRIQGHGRRHGTITGFQVYRGLEKSRFQKHKHFSLYRPCGMLSFFSVVKDRKCRTPSAVCSGERTSHTAHPSPVGVRLRAVSQ